MPLFHTACNLTYCLPLGLLLVALKALHCYFSSVAGAPKQEPRLCLCAHSRVAIVPVQHPDPTQGPGNEGPGAGIRIRVLCPEHRTCLGRLPLKGRRACCRSAVPRSDAEQRHSVTVHGAVGSGHDRVPDILHAGEPAGGLSCFSLISLEEFTNSHSAVHVSSGSFHPPPLPGTVLCRANPA